MTDNKALLQAFDELNAERYDSFFSLSDTHRFSFSYKIQKYVLIHKASRNRPIGRNVSVKMTRRLIVIALLSLLALMGVKAYLDFSIGGFSLRMYPTHSKVVFDKPVDVPTSFEKEYRLAETAGLEFVKETRSPSTIILKYSLNGTRIIFEQALLSVEYYVNTENNPASEITVLGNKGYYIDMDTESYICWTMDGYMFTVVGNIAKDEAAELAGATKIK